MTTWSPARFEPRGRNPSARREGPCRADGSPQAPVRTQGVDSEQRPSDEPEGNDEEIPASTAERTLPHPRRPSSEVERPPIQDGDQESPAHPDDGIDERMPARHPTSVANSRCSPLRPSRHSRGSSGLSIGGADEESAHAPRFIGEWMDDLVPTPASLGVCLVDVGADVDRDDGILRCAGIACYELYRGPPVG
jgi:hypothetical protein